MTATTPALPALPPSPRTQHLQAFQGRADVLHAKLAVLGAQCRDLMAAIDAEHTLRNARNARNARV